MCMIDFWVSLWGPGLVWVARWALLGNRVRISGFPWIGNGSLLRYLTVVSFWQLPICIDEWYQPLQSFSHWLWLWQQSIWQQPLWQNPSDKCWLTASTLTAATLTEALWHQLFDNNSDNNSDNNLTTALTATVQTIHRDHAWWTKVVIIWQSEISTWKWSLGISYSMFPPVKRTLTVSFRNGYNHISEAPGG